ncbi:hypothetical protein L6R53_05180 [Myxococcota bacterium]|nr:hypothetical protein [Myxococcota bacterium]
MIREDFLLRLIRQVIVALVGSRRQRQEAALEQALDALDTSGRSLLGLDLGLVARLPLPTLLALLSPGEELDVARVLAAGLLLRERGEALAALGRGEEALAQAHRGQALVDRALAADPSLAAELQDLLAPLEG